MITKIPPLSDDSIIARATFLSMLDALKSGVDLIETCTNAHQRAQAIAALRVMIEQVREGHQLTADVSYFATHERGRTVAARAGGRAKAAFAHAIIHCLRRDWDSIPRHERKKTHKVWLAENFNRILIECKYEKLIDDPIEFERKFNQVLRWLSPSQRPHP